MSTDKLSLLLNPARLTRVVDIGANPIDGLPPYKAMLDSGLCDLVGFEPQSEALKILLQNKGPNETYFPYAVGDGDTKQMYVCQASGMSSLLPPDPKTLALFNDFERLGEVVRTDAVETRRLDDIEEIQDVDFLKIDVQGSELSVFHSGPRTLSECAVVQTEVSFIPLYEGQPLYWEIDRELRVQGFMPHAFATIKRWPMAPYVHNEDQRLPLNQLLEADMIYVRNIIEPDGPSSEKLKHLALICHFCFGSYDLTTRCLSILADRGDIERSSVDEYFDWIQNGRPKTSTPKLDLNRLSFDMNFDLN